MSQESSLYGWDSPPPALTWSLSDREGSMSPQQARAPSSPTFGVVAPKRSKERPRSRSPIRGPRIFIINGHGSTFLDEHGNIAMIDNVLVDTFTSVEFAHSFGKYIYNPGTCSFFDEPYEYFIKRLLTTTTKTPAVLSTKDTLRSAIYSSLCATRDEDDVIVKEHCKFRCHRKGRKMTDMYIMCSGSPLNEAVICINPLTGEEEDVHDKFGLREVDDRLITYPHGRKEIDRAYDIPIRKADRELDDLRSQMSMLSQPYVRTADNMDIVKKPRKEYDKKYLKLGIVKEALRGAVQVPKYRYKVENRDKYAVLDGKHHMIKLSDAIKIAIEKGTIKPEIDSIVVQACRNFYGLLPSGHDPTKSPGRTRSESPERGGGGRANRRRSRKKYGMNKGKNKNKRKTIRNRKSSKSHKSHKSHKRSNL
jgi:hypothetical protein